MSHLEATYFRGQILQHARRFFSDAAATALQSELVQYLPFDQATQVTGKRIVIPTDLPIPSVPGSPWQVDFNGTTLTLWNRIPKPDQPGWQALPNEERPIWYQHSSGTLLPAWNLFGNLYDLLTFGEESRTQQRDQHGRFAYRFSPRLGAGLLTVPAFNEAAALLAAAALSPARTDGFSFASDFVAGPPKVIFSHDCDILKGNDLITQSIRLLRVIQPVARLHLPRPGNLWWIARNAVTPRRYYADNVTGMVDLERCFGFNSTFYWLNGSGGRFGARSPFSEIARLIPSIGPQWEQGIHYNYDTFLEHDRFAAQLADLQSFCPQRIVSGRAHYLRFDPFRSFQFLEKFGIAVDESSGWADFVGYRNGVAGCFQPYDPVRKAAMNIWEVPMVGMDLALATQHGAKAAAFVEAQLRHFSKIGGALTVLFHPGLFFNPEHPSTLNLYHQILMVCRDRGAVAVTARQIAIIPGSLPS